MAGQGLGTAATRDFYNRTGWRRQNGTLVDVLMFGKADGPIHQALDTQRKHRLLNLVGGPDLRLAELGCGGTPATFLAERCAKFTAVDFSSTGLCEAAIALKSTNVAFETVDADITHLLPHRYCTGSGGRARRGDAGGPARRSGDIRPREPFSTRLGMICAGVP
jgi:hypothetical protein